MAKDPPTITAGELQRLVESWGQKPNIYISQTAPTTPHVVWEGFKENSPHSSKNKLQHIQLSDTTGTSKWHWLLWSDETEKLLFGSKLTR